MLALAVALLIPAAVFCRCPAVDCVWERRRGTCPSGYRALDNYSCDQDYHGGGGSLRERETTFCCDEEKLPECFVTGCSRNPECPRRYGYREATSLQGRRSNCREDEARAVCCFRERHGSRPIRPRGNTTAV